MIEFIVQKENEFGCYSIGKYENNVEIDRLGVFPGDFSKIEEFSPELGAFFDEVWTPQVINTWNEKVEEQTIKIPPTDTEIEPMETTEQQIEDLRMAQHETNMLLMQLISGGVE